MKKYCSFIALAMLILCTNAQVIFDFMNMAPAANGSLDFTNKIIATK